MHATVTIRIKYDKATLTGRSESNIRNALDYAINHLASEGLLSDDEVIVDEWSSEVEIKK